MSSTVVTMMPVRAVVTVGPVVVMVSPRLGGRASDGKEGKQSQDEQQPCPHFTSTGRASDEAPGITEAASVESHCSSSEQ